MATKKDKAELTPEQETEQTNEQKMVKIRLYMGDRKETKQPLTVIVNGMRYDVPRGKEVEVPDYIAAAIADSEEDKLLEMEFNEAASNAFTKSRHGEL